MIQDLLFDDVLDVEFVGLGPKIRHEVSTLGAAERRLVEVRIQKPFQETFNDPKYAQYFFAKCIIQQENDTF